MSSVELSDEGKEKRATVSFSLPPHFSSLSVSIYGSVILNEESFLLQAVFFSNTLRLQGID